MTKGEVSREARGSGHSTENSEEPDQKKLFTDFQRLTTTQSSGLVLISLHFLFTLTLTFSQLPLHQPPAVKSLFVKISPYLWRGSAHESPPSSKRDSPAPANCRAKPGKSPDLSRGHPKLSEPIRSHPKLSEVKKQPTNPTIQCSAMPPTHPPDPPPKPIDTEQSSWFSRPPLNT